MQLMKLQKRNGKTFPLDELSLNFKMSGGREKRLVDTSTAIVVIFEIDGNTTQFKRFFYIIQKIIGLCFPQVFIIFEPPTTGEVSINSHFLVFPTVKYVVGTTNFNSTVDWIKALVLTIQMSSVYFQKHSTTDQALPHLPRPKRKRENKIFKFKVFLGWKERKLKNWTCDYYFKNCLVYTKNNFLWNPVES